MIRVKSGSSRVESLLANIIYNRIISPKKLQSCLESVTAEEKYQALLTSKDICGNTAIHYAADRNDAASVKLLFQDLTLDQKINLLRVQNFKGNTILHWASRAGNLETVKCVLAQLTSAQKFNLLSAQNKKGNSSVHWAARSAGRDAIQYLTASLTPDEINHLLFIKNRKKNTAVHWAARRGDVKLVQVWIESLTWLQKNKLLKSRNGMGETALYWGALCDHSEVVNCMMSILGRQQQLSEGWTTLEVALHFGWTKVAAILQEKSRHDNNHSQGEAADESKDESTADMESVLAAVEEFNQRNIALETVVGELHSVCYHQAQALEIVSERNNLLEDRVDELRSICCVQQERISELETGQEHLESEQVQLAQGNSQLRQGLEKTQNVMPCNGKDDKQLERKGT